MVAAQHRDRSCLLGVAGQVDRVLVEIRRLAAPGLGAPSPGPGPAAAAAVVVSLDKATMPIRSLRSASALIFWNSG
jgi:hypothetical protein